MARRYEFYVRVARTISHSFASLTREILFFSFSFCSVLSFFSFSFCSHLSSRPLQARKSGVFFCYLWPEGESSEDPLNNFKALMIRPPKLHRII